jgi:hypothetical protein
MKNRYITYLLVFIFTFSSNYIFSQVVIPNGILFQAVARDANNNAASNRNIYAIVNILEKTTNGNSEFSESFKVVSSQEGIFTIVIGQGTRLSGVNSLTDINWTKNLHFVNIKIAIEPTLYNPDWSPASNYVDIGTSQLWAVPYSLSAANANFADSATTITTILPSTKGGTGINNNGKNITIANNLTTKGIGDLTITTTGASNITFPTDGLLANTKFVSDRIGADTISLSNRINALSVSSGNSAALKLNISDTATMLSNRIGRDTISLSNRISRDSILIVQNKQAIIDTAVAIRLKLNDKIEVAQFPNLIQPFLANTIFSFQDTITLSNRIDKKLNISDTAGMLSSYVNLTRPQSLVNKSINGVTPTSLANGFTISGGTNTTTTVTVVGDVTIGGVNSGDQLITLTGDVSGSGTGTFPTTINSVGGVSSSTISNLPTRVSTAEANITSNTTSITVEKTRALAAESALDIRIATNTSSITTNIADIATNRANITTNTNNIASNTASITANENAIALRATISSPSFTGTPTAPTAAPGTNTTQIATTEFVSSLVTVAATPDADATTKGKVQLAGDLAGTAGAPLVNKIGGKAVSLGGVLTTASSFTTSGNYSITLTSVGTTNITLPTSGTIATLSGTESLTNKTINGVIPTALANGFTIAGGTNTNTTLTVVGDVTIGGVNSGDQLITLTGDVTGSGTGTFPTTINSVAGVSSSTISNLPTRVTTNETNIASNTASITTNTNSIAALDTRVTSNTASITTNIADIATNRTNITTNATNIAANTASITAEILRAQTAESGLDTRVTTNTASITTNATNIASNTASITTNAADIALRATIASPSFTGTPTAPTAAPGTNTTQIATTEFVSSLVTVAATPDADASTKGKVQLAGDLAGTAGAPLVNKIGGKAVSLGGVLTTASSFTTSGNYSITLTSVGTTNITLPTSGTIATLSGTESLTNKTINGVTPTALANGFTISGGTNTTTTVTVVGDVTIGGVNSGDQLITLTGDVSGSGTGTFPTTINSVGGVSSSTISNLPTRVTTAETNITANTVSITTNITDIATNSNNIAANTASITAEILRAQTAESGLDTRVTTNTASITTNATNIASNTASITANAADIALRATIASPSFTGTPSAPTAAPGTSTTQIATTEFVSTIVGGSATPDATASVKGKIKLTNDFGGTADLPTVNSIGGVSSSTISNLPTRVATAETNIASHTASITSEVTRAQTAESALDTRVAANTASITANTNAIALRSTIASPTFTGVPSAPTAADGTNTTQIATTEFVQTALAAGVASGIAATATPDATSSVKGKIKLTNDLGGTADAPSVNTIGGISSSTISTLPSRVTSAESNIASNTSSITINTTDIATNRLNISTNTADITTNRNNITTNTNNIAANTASITSNTVAIALRATIASPSFTGTPTAPTAADGTNTTQLATTEFVQAALASGVASGIAATATPDATSNVKGKIKLTNDLGGTADLPTVNTVGGVSSSTISTLPTLIASNTASITSNITKINSNTASITTNAANIASNTASITSNTTSIAANTASITSNAADIALRATIASPTFTGIPSAPTAADGNNTTQIATTEFVQAALSSGVASGIAATATPDATSSVKGKIKLTNDLGGTADLPTVNTVGGVNSATISTLPTSVAANTFSITANTAAIALRATIASPTFTGVPTAPTASDGTNTTQIATTEFVQTALNSGVASGIAATATPDATSSVKGKIKLTNDLGGTADLPTVNSVGGVSSSTIGTVASKVNAATDANIASKLVLRDGSGNFAAGMITANVTGSLTGNASTATKLATARNIFGNAFDGSADVTGILPVAYGGTGSTSQNFVDLTTSQTIAGAKTFSGTTTVSGALTVSGSNVFTAGGTAFPTTTGSAGQVLTISAGGSATWTSSTGTSVRDVVDETGLSGFAAAISGQTIFTLSQLPNVNSKVKMYINGVRITNNAYSVNYSTKDVTYIPANNGFYAIIGGDRIQFDYFY